MPPIKARIWKVLINLLETGEWNKDEILFIMDVLNTKDIKNSRNSIWKKRCAVCKYNAQDNYGFVSMEYMVTDSVWASARLLKNEIAHIQCLEVTLGRKLVLDDFTDYPINNLIKWALKK